MKHYLTLAVLVLLAASCGGRRGQGADGSQADSLATEEPAATAAKESPKSAKADTISAANYKNRLPQEPIFDIVTNMGTIRVKLYKDTPKHRDNFARLAITRYYDGLLFHRVIDGFMVQATNCKHLNGEYTVFGETIGGLNVIDRIARVQTDRLDRPVRPVVIQRIRPNEQMNKRALEEEQRALEEAANPTEPEADKKENTNPEEEILLDVQTELKDTSILGGRKLKHRGSKKSK